MYIQHSNGIRHCKIILSFSETWFLMQPPAMLVPEVQGVPKNLTSLERNSSTSEYFIIHTRSAVNISCSGKDYSLITILNKQNCLVSYIVYCIICIQAIISAYTLLFDKVFHFTLADCFKINEEIVLTLVN